MAIDERDFAESIELLRDIEDWGRQNFDKLSSINNEISQSLRDLVAAQKDLLAQSTKANNSPSDSGTGGGSGGGGGGRKPQKNQSFWQKTKDRFNSSKIARAYKSTKRVAGRALGGKGKSGTVKLGKGGKSFAKGAGVAGAAVTGIIAAVTALNDFRKAVTRATDEQLANARKLSDVSGSMAVIFAQADVQEMRRNIRKGREQASSTRALSQADQRRKNAMEPLENAVADIKNRTLAALNDAIIPAIKICADIAQWMKERWPWAPEERRLLGDAVRRELGVGAAEGLAAEIIRRGGIGEEADAIEARLAARRAAERP